MNDTNYLMIDIYRSGKKVSISHRKLSDYVASAKNSGLDGKPAFTPEAVRGMLDKIEELSNDLSKIRANELDSTINFEEEKTKEACCGSKRFLVGQWVRLNSGFMEGSFGRIVSHWVPSCSNQAPQIGRRYLVEIPGCKTSKNDCHWLVEEKNINLLNDNLSVINYKN